VIELAPRFDLVVHGGTVVRADGSLRADVAITDGRIVAVEPGIPARAASESIDATGLLVLPGVVDVHTHTRIATDAEPDRFFRDTMAAAFGGTTTLLAFDNPGTGISDGVAGSAVAAAQEWLDRTRGDAAIDVGLSAVLTGQQDDPVAELPALADLGVASGKCFLVYDFGVDEQRLSALLRASVSARILLEVHGEDREMLDAGIKAQLALGEDGPLGHARSRPPACETSGTRRAIRAAIEARAAVYLVHVSCGDAADEIARARRAGHRVHGETCPHYLSLDESRYDLPRAEAMRAVTSPPLREPAERDRLWRALREGELDLIATDHVPDRLAHEKRDSGQVFTDVSNGAPGVETLLTMAYGVGVPSGRISLERLVDLVSTTPARLFGMPTKGAVLPGRDGDLVLFDPAARRTVRQADLHHTSDFTPYEGLAVTGAVRQVVSRGRVIVRDGAWLGVRGYGRYVARVLE
jgi:dihydropyrimidinase